MARTNEEPLEADLGSALTQRTARGTRTAERKSPSRRRRPTATPDGGSPAKAPAGVRYFASIHPGLKKPLKQELGKRLAGLQEAFGVPVWVLIQQHPHHDGPYADINRRLRAAFFKQRHELKNCGRVAFVIESPGGYARPAYQIATLFRRHCGGFLSIVPSYAKSGATLLALGGDDIYLGMDAELGPLDAQLRDPDREQITSALDEVSALERLHSVALDQFDQTMMLLSFRTEKKTETLLPMAMSFSAEMMKPLLDKIDTVHYTQQSRILKEAEDYAIRLLQAKYGQERAEQIARRLVNNYPEHGFVINREEAAAFLDLPDVPDEQMNAIAELEDYLDDSSELVIGQLKEVRSDGEN